MKKFLSILLAAMMLLGTLTACGTKDDAPGNSQNEDPATSAADTFPKGDITLMLGFAAGAGADLTSRAIMPFVEDILGTNIVIDYNAGSGGELSFTELALNTPKDGYHWTWICTPHVAVYPVSRDTCEYTIDQIQPVCQIAYDPNIFAVQESSPFNTLADLVSYAKAHPGEVTIGHTGVGSDDFIAGMKFMEAADVELNSIAYANGTGDEITALLGGHIDVGVFNASEYSNYEGLKLLGTMASERVEIIPDCPTFIEQGYDIIMSSDRGFAVPAGTDMAIVEKIAAAVEETINNPEFQKKAADLNLLLNYRGPEEFTKYIQDYSVQMQELYNSNPW